MLCNVPRSQQHVGLCVVSSACERVWSGQSEQHVWLYGLDQCQPLTTPPSHDWTPQHATLLGGRRLIRWSERDRGEGVIGGEEARTRWRKERVEKGKETKERRWRGSNTFRIQARNSLGFCKWRRSFTVSWVARHGFPGERERVDESCGLIVYGAGCTDILLSVLLVSD